MNLRFLIKAFQVEIASALTKCLVGKDKVPTNIPSSACSGKCLISKDLSNDYTASCSTETSCTFTDYGAKKYCCTTDDCNKEILIKCFVGNQVNALADTFLNKDCKESDLCRTSSTTTGTTTTYTGSCSNANCLASEFCCNDYPNCNALPLVQNYPKLPTSNSSSSSKNCFFSLYMLVSIIFYKLFFL